MKVSYWVFFLVSITSYLWGQTDHEDKSPAGFVLVILIQLMTASYLLMNGGK